MKLTDVVMKVRCQDKPTASLTKEVGNGLDQGYTALALRETAMRRNFSIEIPKIGLSEKLM